MADEQTIEPGDAGASGSSQEPQPETLETGGVAGAEAPGGEADVRLAAAESEVTALKDQVLRAQAELENVRRRASRDVENAHKFALEKFLGDLLPVIDSLEKAVEVSRNGEVDLGAVSEGVELSLKMLLGVMGKAGVEPVDPLGEPFDPQLHEAMAMVPNPNAEPNSVMDVMQKGYRLNGRLVRAAMVVVSKPPA